MKKVTVKEKVAKVEEIGKNDETEKRASKVLVRKKKQKKMKMRATKLMRMSKYKR